MYEPRVALIRGQCVGADLLGGDVKGERLRPRGGLTERNVHRAPGLAFPRISSSDYDMKGRT
jgi:hypothetical protein